MLKNYYKAALLVLLSSTTILLLWGAFYIDAAYLRPQDPVPSFLSPTLSIPALLLGGVISVVWVVVLQLRIFRPIGKITQYSQKLADFGADISEHKKLVSPEFRYLTRALDGIAQKMRDDQESFRRMQKVRSEFLGNVSHELRTPIFALQGFIETLLEGAIDDPDVNRRFLERAAHQTDRLNHLLRDLIEISRIESGDMKLSLRYFDIDEFLTQLVEELQSVANQQSIKLTLEKSDDEDALVLGDKERIKQVLQNLIENAIKYNVEGGSVRVTVELRKKTAILRIIDTGLGIPGEHKERIFERFYRVDKDRSRQIGGTGLGLAIVKHIVQAHKGTVEVADTPGGGTTFVLTLRR